MVPDSILTRARSNRRDSGAVPKTGHNRARLSQFLSSCIPEPLHLSRRDQQEAATLHKFQEDTPTQELL